jgi:hypothetical protein
MDALERTHPTLALSTLPDYKRAQDALDDCVRALSNAAAYLASRSPTKYRVVPDVPAPGDNDFQSF